jgi:methylmalonyl-CoA mutase
MIKGCQQGEPSDRRRKDRSTNISRKSRSVILIKKRIEQFVKMEGRRPRILVSSLSKKGHDQENKLIASIFAESGFDVDIGPPHQTPQITARMAVENDVHVVCFLSLENAHAEMVADLAKALHSENGEDIRIVIGGAIPEADYDSLYDAGVGLILNSRPVDAVSINRLLDLFE